MTSQESTKGEKTIEKNGCKEESVSRPSRFNGMSIFRLYDLCHRGDLSRGENKNQSFPGSYRGKRGWAPS